MKPFTEIVRKFADVDYSEIPPSVIERVKGTILKDLFEKIGYSHKDIPNFDRILEFIARYEISLWNEEMVFAPNVKEMFELVRGKKFRKPKGLLLFGGYGTGKTLAARIIAARLEFQFYDTHSIELKYLKKDGNDWIDSFIFEKSRNALVIDDIGAEGEIKKFGNESPMGLILSSRASFWERFGTPTIYTSNLASPQEIASRYSNDNRLADRLRAYYMPVEFQGTSLRK